MSTSDGVVLPACCVPSADADFAELAYCTYNAAIPSLLPPSTPTWANLSPSERTRWEAVGEFIVNELVAIEGEEGWEEEEGDEWTDDEDDEDDDEAGEAGEDDEE